MASDFYEAIPVLDNFAEAVRAENYWPLPRRDVAIARKLGADQSLVGVVTRITRTDYAITFKLRDAQTGSPIDVEQTDLRIGANYSWDRGAAWLIKNRLLEKQARQ